MSVTRTNRNLSYIIMVGVLLVTLAASPSFPYAAQTASTCYVDADAVGPSHNGLTWPTAFTTLTDALASSRCTQRIWVASGTYVPHPSDSTVAFNLKNGVAVYGGFAGTETALSERVLHLNDADFSNDSILSGEIGDPEDLADNSRRILRLDDANLAATRLDGFVIQNGYADDPVIAEGAGIYVTDSVGTLANLLFRNNYAAGKGAGLSNAFSQLSVENVVFDGNTSEIFGGGLHDYQSANTYTHLTFRNNQSGSGGGAYFYDSTSTLTDALFEHNLAIQDGGALSVLEGSPSFSDTNFEYNRAEGSDSSRGGAISIGAGGSPTFTRITVSNNHSNGDGGGIYSAGNGAFTNVILSYNMAGTLKEDDTLLLYGRGGGILLEGNAPVLTNLYLFNNTASGMGGGIANSYASSPTIINSIFEGNTALDGGGGMEVIGPHSSPRLINCTFVNNTAKNGQGGGLFALGGGEEATVRVFNSIFWGNTRGSSDPVPSQIHRDDPSQLTVSYSDIQGGYSGAGNINADPLFIDPEASNFRLSDVSPAIDAGDNSALPGGVTRDYDGRVRLANVLSVPDSGAGTAPLVDMGAFEVQAPYFYYLPMVFSP